MSIKYDDIFPAEVVSVQGKPYLFSNLRIERGSIHPRMHVYDVRDDCDGEFWQIQKFVMVNHWATIIGLEPLDLEDDQYCCPPDPEDPDRSSEGIFLGLSAESHSDFVVWYHSFKSYAKAAAGKEGAA